MLRASAELVQNDAPSSPLDARIDRVKSMFETAGFSQVPGDDAIRDALAQF